MKKITVLCFFMSVFVAVSAFAQVTKPKVVVIPLNSSKTQNVIENGDQLSATLIDFDTYIMSGTDVSLPKDGTCVVTATAHVTGLDGGDDLIGPFFRTARQTGAGSPGFDPWMGAYMLHVGAPFSTPISATYAWDMAADTIYRFGCSISQRPANWSDGGAWCRVTWICSAD